MKKILHVIGYLGMGGDTSVVLNVKKMMDEEQYSFDFLTHEGARLELVKYLRKCGSNVYILPGDVRKLGPIKYYKKVLEILRKIPFTYDAIHVHTSMQSGLALAAAKHAGIKIRICHSHTNQIQRKTSFLKRIVAVPFLRILYMTNANVKVACSKSAGKFLFGKSSFITLYNGIDINRFSQVENESVKALRKEIGITDNDIVVGQVANFGPMKNQCFAIQIAQTVYKNRPDIKFVFVGSGKEFGAIKHLAKEKECNVYFMGQRTDVERFIHLFDCIILPSKPGEGFPVTMIEAQAVGTKCIISDNVTNEVDVGLGLITQLPLQIEQWVDQIKKLSRDQKRDKSLYAEKMIEMGYDNKTFTEKWLTLYERATS